MFVNRVSGNFSSIPSVSMAGDNSNTAVEDAENSSRFSITQKTIGGLGALAILGSLIYFAVRKKPQNVEEIAQDYSKNNSLVNNAQEELSKVWNDIKDLPEDFYALKDGKYISSNGHDEERYNLAILNYDKNPDYKLIGIWDNYLKSGKFKRSALVDKDGKIIQYNVYSSLSNRSGNPIMSYEKTEAGYVDVGKSPKELNEIRNSIKSEEVKKLAEKEAKLAKIENISDEEFNKMLAEINAQRKEKGLNEVNFGANFSKVQKHNFIKLQRYELDPSLKYKV